MRACETGGRRDQHSAFNNFIIWRNKRKETIQNAIKFGDSYELAKGRTVDDIKAKQVEAASLYWKEGVQDTIDSG